LNKRNISLKINDSIEIEFGDCLELMQNIPDKSIDMILCDLPYGTTQNKWDAIIPFDKLWNQYNRIIKGNGAIVLFGQNKFSAKLMLSNEEMYRYSLVWDKVLPSGFLNSGRMQLRQHEDLLVFYKKLPIYNPQKIEGNPNHTKGKAVGKMNSEILDNNNYHDFKVMNTEGTLKFPTSILSFQKPHPSKCLHPTQKPVELLENLIKTYTNETDLVLDNCAGAFSTAIACINTNRKFIGYEKEKKYFEIGKNRILKELE